MQDPGTGSTLTMPAPPAGPNKFSTGSLKMDMGLGWFLLGVVAVLCLAALTYCSLAAFWPKFSRAEVFFAECAREMILDQNYITPLYHHVPFFDKPILVYWLIISMFHWIGLSHFAARIPSIVFALLTVALTCACGVNLFGRRTGLMASAMLATSFMFLSFASLCMSDMLLVFFDTLTLTLLYWGARSPRKRDVLWGGAALSLALAFMTKGPIGVVLPGAAFLAYLFLTKQLKFVKWKHVLIALTIVTCVVAPWFVAVYKTNGMGALIYFFVHENWQRFAGSAYDVGRPFWTIIVSFFLGFAPWSFLLPLAFAQFLGTPYRTGNRKLRHQEVKTDLLYLWLWVFIAVGFFCCSRGKCDYYTLPAYPAAALLAAKCFIEQMDKRTVFAKGLFAVFGCAFIATGVASFFIVPNISGGLSTAWYWIPTGLLSAGVVVLALLAMNQEEASFSVAVAGIFIGTMLCCINVFPIVSSLEPIGKYASLLNGLSTDTKVGVDEPLHSWIDEISFQTGRHPITLNSEAQMQELLSGPSPALVLISENKLESLPAGQRAKLIVLTRDSAITHSLTPGYVLQHKGQLADPVPVVLVSNQSNVAARHPSSTTYMDERSNNLRGDGL